MDVYAAKLTAAANTATNTCRRFEWLFMTAGIRKDLLAR
jgi:hypothetical protein